MKKVLVLLSTYNGEKYLKEQIDSVLAQKNTDVSILVRDDGSTDKTLEILEKYKKDGKLEWYTGKNLKPAKSFLNLVRCAETTYDYYAFCDQDDFWYSDKISEAIYEMEKEPTMLPKLCYCNIELVDKNRRHLDDRKISNRCNFFDEMLLTYCVPGCTMVFNRNLLDIVKKHMPTKITMHDCWIYFVCVAVGGRIYSTESIGIQYRQHGGNVIGTNHISVKNKFKMILGKRKSPRQQMVAEILEQFTEDLKNGKNLESLKIFSKYSNSSGSAISKIFISCLYSIVLAFLSLLISITVSHRFYLIFLLISIVQFLFNHFVHYFFVLFISIKSRFLKCTFTGVCANIVSIIFVKFSDKSLA